MTVRTRLVTTIAGVAILAALPSIYAVQRLGELRDIASDLRREHAAAFVAVGRLQTSLAEFDRYQRSYVAAPAMDLRRSMFGALTDAESQIEALTRHGFRDEAAPALARLAVLDKTTREIDALITAGRVEEATSAFVAAKPALTEVQNTLEPIAQAIDASSSREIASAERISAGATGTMFMTLVVSFVVALLLGLWSARGLVRPIRQLRSAMANVADGALAPPADLPYDRNDEVGDLSRSFRAMTQQLAELDRLKAEFISMASHDLKTPINVISGYAELMEEGIFGELTTKQREVLGSINEQTKVLTRLVTQILDISRMEAGGFRIEVTEVVLADLFDAVQRTFEALARQKEIDFRTEIDADVPGSLALDPDRLRNEVLGNLLSNAFKFTQAGGTIRVHAGRDGDTLKIRVTDTGIGIPADQLGHIFDKYYQIGAHARTTGTGLGLAIAREIVEAHGGTIHAQSEPDRGSAFELHLPIRHVSSASHPA